MKGQRYSFANNLNIDLWLGYEIKLGNSKWWFLGLVGKFMAGQMSNPSHLTLWKIAYAETTLPCN